MWPFSRSKPADPAERDDHAVGRRGEDLACEFLRKKGWKILARNFRCPVGEADVIALAPKSPETFDRQAIVFVEVKTRTSDSFAAPESAVGPAKKKKLTKIANYYLKDRDHSEMTIRFDILSVVIPPDSQPRINHIEQAF